MSETKKSVMSQAQVFASAWSLVGGRFDMGYALDDAEQAKAELAEMVGAIIQQRDELLAELQALVKSDEQSAFEGWLRITCPSGDVESVQRQWEESSLYSNFLADTEKARAAIAKAEAAK